MAAADEAAQRLMLLGAKPRVGRACWPSRPFCEIWLLSRRNRLHRYAPDTVGVVNTLTTSTSPGGPPSPTFTWRDWCTFAGIAIELVGIALQLLNIHLNGLPR